MGSVCHKHPFFPVSGPVWPCFSRFWAKNHPKMVRFRAKLTFYTIRRTKTGFLRPYGPENGKTVFSVLIIAFGTNWDPFPDLFGPLWTYFFRFRTRLTLFFPVFGLNIIQKYTNWIANMAVVLHEIG